MTKEAIIRGSRKRFQTTITDLEGNPQDPYVCYVRLEKVGVYTYGSPTVWYECTIVGGDSGVVYADIWLNNSLTLGDWLARFKWSMVEDGDLDYDAFYFTLIRKDKPWVSKTGPNLG